MPKRKYKKGEIILEQGTSGEEMYIIKKGTANVFKIINKRKTKLGTLKQDDFFGEMSLLLNYPRSATIVAAENLEIIFCNKKDFLEMVRAEPKIADQILTTMAKRLMEAHNIIIKLEGEKKSLKVMYGIK